MSVFLPPLAPPAYVVAVLLAGTIAVITARVMKARIGQIAPTMSAIGAFVTIIGILLLLLSSGTTFVTFYIPALFSSGWAAAAAVPIGIFLFFLRKTHRATYGLLEIFGALAAIIVTAGSQYATNSQRATALLGAVYFLIRGLDNADQGNLLDRLRSGFLNSRGGYFRLSAIGLSFIGLSLATLTDNGIKPPYRDHAKGPALPVSAMECGEVSVICDEAAWREKFRLTKAPLAEREAAELAARKAADIIWQRGQPGGDRQSP